MIHNYMYILNTTSVYTEFQDYTLEQLIFFLENDMYMYACTCTRSPQRSWWGLVL